jgi:hypothetical protein
VRPSPRTSVLASTALVAAVLVPGVAAAAPADGDAEQDRAAVAPSKVLVVTIDSLSSRALRVLGEQRAPNLHRLIAEGASTLNARTVRERTTTLPNHTSIVTGRPVDRRRGGHGVEWNDERARPRTVQRAAGHAVGSMFSVVDSRRRHPALFASKSKLAIYHRSWPRSIDRLVVEEDNDKLVRRTRHDLTTRRRALTFVHLSWPDEVGHEHGFLSEEHLAAISDSDRHLGKLLATIEAHRQLRRRLALVVTADHGGAGHGHMDPGRSVNHRIPFLVWGVGVASGQNLYRLNADYRNPRRRQPAYDVARPPVRNGDVANLVTDLLGLPAVEGSRFNARQHLDVS